MIKAEYWNPGNDSTVTSDLVSEDELPGLLDAVLGLHGGRGHPALVLLHPEGSSLSIATDGARCALIWINALEEAFHSSGGSAGLPLVYDYFGSWSEAPAEWAITIPEALDCARRFLRHGAPRTGSVLFEQD